MSASLPLSLSPRVLHTPFFNVSSIPITFKPSFNSLTNCKRHICFAIPGPDTSNFEREEARWLREEQRWLREEQRWLREEQRWNEERTSLLRQIETLELKIEKIKLQNSDNVGNLAAVLKAEGVELGNKVGQITETGSSAAPIMLKAAAEVAEEAVVVKEVVAKERATLRMGAEGDEVRTMQEALQELGFYPGEEDIEYSSFSTGTERAVKTWQATIGIREDGIMTAENLERLYAKQKNEDSGLTLNADPKGNRATPPQALCFDLNCANSALSNSLPLDNNVISTGAGVVCLPSEKPRLIFFKGDIAKQGANGATDSLAGISDFQQKVVDGVAKAELSSSRVFLLGENRWEDPSRLTSLKKPVGGAAGANSMGAATKCVTCLGEGRLLCTECDGTGEPNIEQQFMEWVDEGTKCPYCEGLGYTICDVCGGQAFITA
ncbi:LOW QUALITY PROTEIN: hypothetical protein RJ639_023807 [Escallonia herrerae]|uniref:Peptidoglycan binding-like domain-containing protein n=1 Tax=Escallonia herrerae TaxID=1293975 RepID=A0AA88V312_9ASTE|nr:LOW QUALITY PROTEIN: hypothetical protein RJ639_023807 [Escallonia herrerae]